MSLGFFSAGFYNNGGLSIGISLPSGEGAENSFELMFDPNYRELLMLGLTSGRRVPVIVR